MPARRPWLAPLVVPTKMEKELEAARAKLARDLGVDVPKTMFVRLLLERGMQAVAADGLVRTERGVVAPTASTVRKRRRSLKGKR